jgi:hypothetical protein
MVTFGMYFVDEEHKIGFEIAMIQIRNITEEWAIPYSFKKQQIQILMKIVTTIYKQAFRR